MSLVRARLGADAIIVSTEEDETGATRVTAAVERSDRPLAASEPDVIDLLNEALNAHGLAPTLIEKILCAALPFETDDPLLALAGALTSLYRFAPVDGRGRAAAAAGRAARRRQDAVDRQARRARRARPARRRASSPPTRCAPAPSSSSPPSPACSGCRSIASTARSASAPPSPPRPGELVLIDSAGVNPYNAGDRRELAQLIAGSGAEPVLVLPAGGDPLDTVDMARIFRDLGCARADRDAARHGAAPVAASLAVIDTLNLGLSEASLTPEVANGLTPFNAVVLARLLLPKPAREQQQAGARRSAP